MVNKDFQYCYFVSWSRRCTDSGQNWPVTSYMHPNYLSNPFTLIGMTLNQPKIPEIKFNAGVGLPAILTQSGTRGKQSRAASKLRRQ